MPYSKRKHRLRYRSRAGKGESCKIWRLRLKQLKLFASGTAKGRKCHSKSHNFLEAEVTTANTTTIAICRFTKRERSLELDRKRLALETTGTAASKASLTRVQHTLGEQVRQAKATLDGIAEVRPVDDASWPSEVDKAIAAVKRLMLT